ncbi:putative rRNA processing protein [Talaromyces proteolyticus]|uniref:Pre-rRNA-processing protein PNO1 n=1 Tax=Talaromyces proteolyticus TaxID=1131652 RepID=A0AAD4PXZ9_9EURO|nr:putative rRNA processing protein [Talaromyces proteolyticus]KAH8693521.1 putative rRNA processing protein [Talaromyces proteolyticus]
MPAPTALKTPQVEGEDLSPPATMPSQEEFDEVLIDAASNAAEDLLESAKVTNPEDSMHIDEEGRPVFTPAKDTPGVYRIEMRRVPIPPNRMSPLKTYWPKIYPPLVEHLKLQVRMNVKNRAVELRNSKLTTDPSALQRGEDFIRAFTLCFDVDDAIALLRLDDLYINSFEIKDVKSLSGDHLSRAIGRIAGQNGKTKFAIENATRTRVVLAGQKVHILGTFKNAKMAQEAVVSLILGSPPVCATILSMFNFLSFLN